MSRAKVEVCRTTVTLVNFMQLMQVHLVVQMGTRQVSCLSSTCSLASPSPWPALSS